MQYNLIEYHDIQNEIWKALYLHKYHYSYFILSRNIFQSFEDE